MSSSATGHSFHFFKKTIPLGLSAAHEGITQNMLCTCLRVLPCVCVRARLGNCHANRDHPATIATFFCYLFFARKKKSNLIWWHSTGFWCDTKEIFFVFFFLRRRRPLYSFCLLLLLWSIGGGRRKRRRALRKACHIVSLGHGRLRSTAWR